MVVFGKRGSKTENFWLFETGASASSEKLITATSTMSSRLTCRVMYCDIMLFISVYLIMVPISYYLIMYTKLTAALIGAKLTVLTFGLSRVARSSSSREYFS